MRALVVEDEAALREGLREQLVKQGFTVDVAADGEEGLFAGNEYPLDIAVIDLGLPKLSVWPSPASTCSNRTRAPWCSR